MYNTELITGFSAQGCVEEIGIFLRLVRFRGFNGVIVEQSDA